MIVIVTGVTGFAGSHLADLLVREWHAVVGTYRWRSPMENIAHLADSIKLEECDMRDANSVRKLVDKIRPEIIFHLAAQSFVPTSWHAPEETIATNVLGTVHVLDAVREIRPGCTVHIAGSSEEYGTIDSSPITESYPLRPLSPYGVSKVGQDLLGYQYKKSYGLNIVRTRAFNHSGARRSPMFVLSGFVKSFVDVWASKNLPAPIDAGNRPRFPIHIKHGNLEAVRDFVHVRDVVRAYYELATKVQPMDEAVNICSGRGYHIWEALRMVEDFAREKLGLQQGKDFIYEADPTRMRPSDVPVLIGSNFLMGGVLGWKPLLTLGDIIDDLFVYWIGKTG